MARRGRAGDTSNVLMVGPGGGAVHMTVPPPPTMDDIREAFTMSSDAGERFDDDHDDDAGGSAAATREAAEASRTETTGGNGQNAPLQAAATSPKIQNPFEAELEVNRQSMTQAQSPQQNGYRYQQPSQSQQQQQQQNFPHANPSTQPQHSPHQQQHFHQQHLQQQHCHHPQPFGTNQRFSLHGHHGQQQHQQQQQCHLQHQYSMNDNPPHNSRSSQLTPSPGKPPGTMYNAGYNSSSPASAGTSPNGVTQAGGSIPDLFWSSPSHLSKAGAFHESFVLSPTSPHPHDLNNRSTSFMHNEICNPFDSAANNGTPTLDMSTSTTSATSERRTPVQLTDMLSNATATTTPTVLGAAKAKQVASPPTEKPQHDGHHERTPSTVEEVMQASLEFRRSLGQATSPAEAAAAIKDAVKPVDTAHLTNPYHPHHGSSDSLSPYGPKHLYPSSERVEHAMRSAPLMFDEPPLKKPAASSKSQRRSIKLSTTTTTTAAAGNVVDLLDDCKLKASTGGASPVYEAFATSSLLDNVGPSAVSHDVATAATVDCMAAQDEELIALKWAAYNGSSRSATTSALHLFPEQQATVVAITDHDVHPSDMDAVRAELIGEDYNNIAHGATATNAAAAAQTAFAVEDAPTVTATQHVAHATATSHTAFPADESETLFAAGEATIIDRETNWHPPHEEAVVLPDDNTSFPYVDVDERKRPAIPTPNDHWAHAGGGAHTETSSTMMPGIEGQAEVIDITEEYSPTQEAVVVGISEEFHPAEVAEDAQAELIGPDYNCTVAVPERNTRLASRTTSATVATTPAAHVVEAAAVLCDDPCTPNVATARAYSTGAIRQAPMSHSARAVTAPAFVGSNPFVDDPFDSPAMSRDALAALDAVVEDDRWMHAPSSIGQHFSDPIVVPMQPPVAVASLDAYASSPALEGDRASRCSVEAPESGYPPQRPLSSEPAAVSGSTDSEGNGLPPRTMSEGGTESVSSASTKGGGFQKLTSGIVRGMEMLFGDAKIQDIDNEKAIVPRTLLPWSVIYSEATNMWVATVNTNQKALDSNDVVEASKSLRAFSVMTQKQASCLAKAWSPPRRHALSKNPVCAMCKSKFALLRRACHCRNCGICVCNNCVVPWPSKMVPETYNRRKESFVNICKGCDWLCTNFRLALLEGNLDKTIAIHATGNVNVGTPFANVKGELFYPVHCAVLGGNLDLLKWLVEDNCCPIKSIRVSGRCRDAQNSFTEVSTSKGRSLLGIALENRNISIVRYLVVEKGIPLSGERDLNVETLSQNLDLVLRLLPEDVSRSSGAANAAHQILDVPIAVIEEAQEYRRNDTGSDGSVTDACIICFENTINSVATPCGHQVCCLKCSNNITRCPVCAVECSFMRVFRP